MNNHDVGDPHKNIHARYFRTTINSLEALIFLFHGRGGDCQSVYEQLGKHLLRDDMVIVAPQASSNCWYPHRFNEPVNMNQPWLDSAVNWIHREINEFIQKGLVPEKIVFGGFSQGACLALEYLLRYPQHYGGVFCLSGGMIGPEGSRQALSNTSLAGTPVFLGCADEDEWIPRAKFDESVGFLLNSGAQVESIIYKNLGHNICEDELNYVKCMIDNLFKVT